MGANQLSLKIAHLYPKLLNLYGDRGNILALQKRCQWREIEIQIEEINIGDSINPDDFDIYFIGGGQDKQQVAVSVELQNQKEKLQYAAQNNAVFLGICGGYQLFGKYYLTGENSRLEGINLLDVYTKAGTKRLISNVCARCEFIPSKTIVGFENHSGLTYLEGSTTPIAKIITGNGNNGSDKTEGARKNNVFGTYLHGSFLPKNPEFADYLIKLALDRKYQDNIALSPLDDTIETDLQKQLSRKNF